MTGCPKCDGGASRHGPKCNVGLVDHRSAEAQAISRALADQHERLSAAIHEWAQGDDELGWPGDDILKDRGNCDDLAAFLLDGHHVKEVGP